MDVSCYGLLFVLSHSVFSHRYRCTRLQLGKARLACEQVSFEPSWANTDSLHYKNSVSERDPRHNYAQVQLWRWNGLINKLSQMRVGHESQE